MRLKLFLLLLVVLIAAGCAGKPPKHNLHESMIKFDGKYIPALFFVRLHRVRESELALDSLRFSWNEFHLKFYKLKMTYGVNIVDKFWQSDFDRINTLITSTEGFVKVRDFDRAQDELARVREVFAALRSRNGVDYLLDRFNFFDQKLAELQAKTQGKSRFTDRELRELRTLCDEAYADWSSLIDFEIDPALYGFSKEKIAAIKKKAAAEQKVLEVFKQSLNSDQPQPDEIFAAAQALRPTFVVLYKAFGDFQPIFDAIIKERDAEGGRGNQKEEKRK